MTNIWQRFKLLLTRELNNAHEDATVAALRCVIRAAEDAEREGHDPDCDPIGCKHDMTHDASPPVQGLPPFVDAINMLAIDGVISASRARELTGQPVFEQRAWFRAHRQEIESESERENAAILRVRTPAAAPASGECADLRVGEADGNGAAGRRRDDGGPAEAARSEGLLRASGTDPAQVKSAGEATLPPLDPALVEECLSIYESVDALAVPSMRDALTHYRERVERPLRETADRLRAELNQYDERGHDAQIEIDRLRGELADVRASHDRLIDVVAQESYACGIGDTMTPEERVRQMRHHFDRAAPQPTDEERKRLASAMRYYAGTGASNLVMVHMRADDLRRIATLLEEPPRRHARKSLGRRFVLRFEDGEISTRTHYDLHSAEVCASAAGAEIIECDLVPVEEEKP